MSEREDHRETRGHVEMVSRRADSNPSPKTIISLATSTDKDTRYSPVGFSQEEDREDTRKARS